MSKIIHFPSAQEALIAYFRSLSKSDAKREIEKIVYPNIYGTRINTEELAKAYEKLGYDGKEAVKDKSYDFKNRLVGIYREILK